MLTHTETILGQLDVFNRLNRAHFVFGQLDG